MDSNQRSSSSSTWLYIVAWLFFLYIFITMLSFTIEEPNSPILAGMYFINFGVHEVSHIVMSFFPPIVTAAAGSIGEICFTLLVLFAALKAKSHFAAVFAGLWVMLACISAGEYMADANAQSLPLIGPGETVQHDWHFVFSQLGWLNSSVAIGGTVRFIGIAAGVASLLFGVYFILQKHSSRDS